MKRSRVALLLAGAVVLALCAVAAVVGPQTIANRVIRALGGVACTEEQCPPDAAWTAPVAAPVTSGFRSPDRPDHHGVDLVADRGTPVVAASAGLVLTAECQASLDAEPYGCDRDGSPEVGGCGWYVKILHAGTYATLYCHLLQEPEVSAGELVETGDPIGVVGSSGNSSAPHLHFEVQGGSTFNPPRSATAIDPVEFMAAREAALGAGPARLADVS